MAKVETMDYRQLMQTQNKTNEKSSVAKDNKVLKEYDFKIISFRIGSEFYGVDIMAVKEILKENKFTRIPNALDFVRGVLNLRGDIIPVIDLGIMFGLKEKKKFTDELQSIIIIKVENLLIGIIVEQIQHVISLSKSDIQPPSPLLGGINERYITGVVGINEDLFVVLDTDSIFSDKEKVKKETIPQESDLSEEFFIYFMNQIAELCGIHINPSNKAKFRDFYNEYAKENGITEMPKVSKEIAQAMVSKFHSLHTDEFWGNHYVDLFSQSVLNEVAKICSDEVRILDVGCGNGFEPFSIYIAAQKEFPHSTIKVTAMDTNLAAVSAASGLEVEGNIIPAWMNKDMYFVSTYGASYKIKKEINDNFFFEFHDAKNISVNHKKFDIIVARDMSLQLKDADYEVFINSAAEKLSKGGVLMIGDNEVINHASFNKVPIDRLMVYVKK